MELLIKNKKYLCLLLLVAVVFSFALLPPLTALAQNTASDSVTAKENAAAGAAMRAAAIAKDDAAKADTGGLFSWMKGSAILFISSTISSIFGAVFGVVLWLEAMIIDYVLSPTNFPFVGAKIVQLGWGITRDIANMFFILILLVIAFATVLRIDSYAIKQLWWKVLVAALLINFSLVIAGFVIDFTQVLTTFFLKQATGGGSFGTITTRLASSMQILNFYNPAAPESLGGGLLQFGASSIAAVVGIILTLVGLVVTVFVFGATAIFLIVRILWIWFLLIIAPLAWMSWILPTTSGYFKQWWDKFINWTFFAPAYAFMIYLSLSIFDANGKFLAGNLPSNSIKAWGESAPGLTTVAMPAAIFQWILVIAMMFGSLIVAQKFGVGLATNTQKTLTDWGQKSKNWAGRQLRRTALGVGAKEAAPGVEARPGLLVRGAQRLAATGILGRRLIANQAFKMAAGEAKTVEEAQKGFANWTPEAIQAYLKNSPGRISDALFRNQQMGAALALKDKGKLDKVGEDRIKDLAALASQQYPKQLDEILKVAPHLATMFNKKIKEVVTKIDKPDEMMTDSLGYAQVVANLNPQQFKTIVQKAKDDKIKVLKKTIDIEFDALGSAVKTTIQNEILNKTKEVVKVDSNGNKTTEQITISKEARNNALRELAEQSPYAEKIARAKFTTGSPAWEL